jgi:hypothetical protein
MTIARSVAEILSERVTVEVESIDRLYLNMYQPRLMHAGGVAQFFRAHQGATFASSALMAPMTRAFQAAVVRFAELEDVPVVRFAKGQRKDDVMHEHLAAFDREEGVLFVGVAQERRRYFGPNAVTARMGGPTRGSFVRPRWSITTIFIWSTPTSVRCSSSSVVISLIPAGSA